MFWPCRRPCGQSTACLESSGGQTWKVWPAAKVILRAEFVAAHSDTEGQAITALVGGILVTSVHRRPAGESHGILYGHLNEVLALASSRKCDTAFIGDWNLEPRENILGDSDVAATAVLAHSANAAAVGGYAPTRWKGRRAIDYVMMPVGKA